MNRLAMRLAPWVLVLAVLASCSDDGGGSSPEACSPQAPTGTCGTGETCFEGGCVPTASLCTVSNPTGACATNKTCLDGTCQLDTALCGAGNPSGLCAAGSTCFQSACTPSTALCSPGNPTGLCESGKVCSGGACVTSSAECDKPLNQAHRAALVAAQPALGVQSGTGKTVITADAHWTSLDGGTDTCSVSLQFKDSSGNGTLDPYEDWTLTATARATDLLGRLTTAQKAALMAHASLNDVPSSSPYALSAGTQALVDAGIRFGRTAANTAAPLGRATWANSLQRASEAAALGIPFVLSSEPLHHAGNGRTKAKGFALWPPEQGLAATGSLPLIEDFGQFAAADYRAIGIRMALSPSADLATDARWFGGQFTFGEDSPSVSARVAAYVRGFQGDTLGPSSVACVVKSFPGAGAAKDGWDARLAKGKFLTYPGNALEAHLAAFEGAFDEGVAGVTPAYGILERGTWSALGGLLDGSTIEQVGGSFNHTLITDVLRGHYEYDGLVLAPWGVLEDASTSPLGAPWGHETATRAERAGAAIDAGVDQFGGLGDPTPITDARTAGLVTDGQLDAAAGRALSLALRLGLFENPYVDASAATDAVFTEAEEDAAIDAYHQSIVLLHNVDKAAGFLNGFGDGTQLGDKGNAGNGTGKVLPAPPGQVYAAPGAAYYVGSGFDVDAIRNASTDYGEFTNDSTIVGCESCPKCQAPTVEKRIACSHYYLVRLPSPFAADPDSGSLNLPLEPLGWADNGLAAALSEIQTAKAAIAANPGPGTQIIVGVDAGRLPIVDELVALGVGGIYVEWMPPGSTSDKFWLEVAFGYANGVAKLPTGIPLSTSAVQASKEDLAGDGQSATHVRGYGLNTPAF